MAAIVHASGQILALVYAPVPDELLPPDAENVAAVASADQERHYWTGEELAERQEATISADAASVWPDQPITISAPPGSWLRLNGVFARVEGGSFSWSSPTPAAVAIELAGPLRSNRLVLRAVDPVAFEAKLKARIDAEAGEARKRFITSAAGQELTYQRKEAEARAWLASGAPALVGTDFPFLAAEAAATGQDVGAAAAAIVAAADLWSAVGSAIEGARIAAKRAVAAAATADDKHAAASVDWAALTA
jgi:hypothetical protein